MQNYLIMQNYAEQMMQQQMYRRSLTPTQLPVSMELTFGIDRILNMTCSTELKNRDVIITKGPVQPTKNSAKGRRRTIFTDFQLAELQQAFTRSKYLVGNERVDLASRLGLEAKSVKIWFQNRRIKQRRGMKHSDHSSTSDSD